MKYEVELMLATESEVSCEIRAEKLAKQDT